MQQTDYSMIVLTKEQKKVFRKFKKSNSAILTIDEFKVMNGTALLEQAIDGKSTWFDVNVTKGVCKLSKHGIKYRAYLKEQKKLFWLKNTWIPILVSFSTTLTTNYILPKLLQILK